eukprot:gene5846-7042_t
MISSLDWHALMSFISDVIQHRAPDNIIDTWDTTDPCTKDAPPNGLTCAVIDGEMRVVGITLPSMRLVGRLDKWEFLPGSLHALETLDLNDNMLSGSIPTSFGQLTSLRILSLGVNAITGIFPSNLGALSRLEMLNLDGGYVASLASTKLVGYADTTPASPATARQRDRNAFFPATKRDIVYASMHGGRRRILRNTPASIRGSNVDWIKDDGRRHTLSDDDGDRAGGAAWIDLNGNQ